LALLIVASHRANAVWGCVMSDKPKRGGKRKNQTGRPPKGDARRVRVGMLFLPPDARQALVDQAGPKEKPVQVAARLLIHLLS
jgi:hypothetical protein